MDRKIDKVFDSQRDNGKGYFQIASGYISETVILFERENIIAVVRAKGSADFYDRGGKLLAQGRVTAEDGGRAVYEQLRCRVREDAIVLDFPVCKWIDNYPHCDGEHDRWDCVIIGSRTMTFDRKNHTVG